MTEVGSIYQNLRDRLAEVITDYKHLDDEFKNYRHEIRAELQRILIDIDRIQQDRVIRGGELKDLRETVSGLTHRLDEYDREKSALKGGFSVVRWLWTGIGAILLAVLAWALGKYAT